LSIHVSCMCRLLPKNDSQGAGRLQGRGGAVTSLFPVWDSCKYPVLGCWGPPWTPLLGFLCDMILD
jgi:hypothetical protein